MPWLEDLKFPRGYQMGTHKKFYRLSKEDYEEFTDTICANKEYWIDCCSEYNDGISEW